MRISEFDGKCYAITGACSGIGIDMVRKLDKAGARLLLLEKSEEQFSRLNGKLQGKIHKMTALDLSETPEALFDIILETARDWGPFSGGIHYAATCFYSPLKVLTMEQIDNIMRVNVAGAMFLAKALSDYRIREERGGSIIFIGSVAGLEGEKGVSLYSASKAALISLTRSLALEVAPLSIRVNCISPGWIYTPMVEMMSDLYVDGLEKIETEHPLGLGTPEDISNTVSFLLSERSRWITGTNMVVDGGYLA